MPYTLEQCLSQRGMILCPNNYIHHRSIEETSSLIDAGYSLNILPINAFFQQLWQEHQLTSHQELPRLLNASQERQVWKSIVSDIIITKHQLLHEGSLIEQIQQSWHTFHQWQIPLSASIIDDHKEYRQLLDCFEAFRQYCGQNNWIDKTCMIDLLIEVIDSFTLPKEIGLNGFIAVSPQTQAFFNSLQSCGIKVSAIQSHRNKPEIHHHVFDNQTDEIATMLHWAEQRRLSGDKKIGCIAPQLPFMVKAIQRSCLDLWGKLDKVQIAQTTTLTNYPMISLIFDLHILNRDSIDVSQLCQIIRSPFLGNSITENTQRSLLCYQLHRLGQYEIDKNYFFHLCKRFAANLYSRLTSLRKVPKPQSHQAWLDYIQSSLAILGWPGERSLTSEEYQLRDKFFDALEEFTRLEAISGAVDFSQAIDDLQQCCATHHFQAQAEQRAIHIITPIDAMGVQFDAVWVMNMDEDTWPPPANPNPFIPHSVTPKHPYPHCDNYWEMEYCKAFSDGFLNTAPIVHFSHTGQAEGNSIAVSPLLSPTSYEDMTLLASHKPQALQAFKDPGKSYPASIDSLPGGSACLKSQALCPFQAFARYRLKARSYPQLHMGLDPGERGSLVHRVLELLWTKVSNSAELKQYDEPQRTMLVTQCVNQALEPLKHRFDYHFLRLEAQRLSQLILPWLQLECSRPDFEVEAVEKEINIKLAGHQIKTRLDRVDRLSDGSQLVIDYKTGEVSLSHCFGERPEEPQLPLYCMSSTQITAMAFAKVHPAMPKILGISNEDIDINGVKCLPIERLDTANNWSNQRQQWQDQLNTLAEEFCQGLATVRPKNHQQTCIQCDLQALCRVNDKHE